MRIRTGHGPDDWHDEGPGVVTSSVIRGSLVVGGDWTPARIRERLDRRAADARRRTNAKKAIRLRWDALPVCGAPVRFSTEPCARTAGHGNSHSTAATLAKATERRRAA